EGLDSQQLSQNLTFATNFTLRDGSLDGNPLRLRVQKVLIFPKLNINLYSEVVKSDIRARMVCRAWWPILASLIIFGTGVMYVINHPLFPPLSVFQELFILLSAFSFSVYDLLAAVLHADGYFRRRLFSVWV